MSYRQAYNFLKQHAREISYASLGPEHTVICASQASAQLLTFCYKKQFAKACNPIPSFTTLTSWLTQSYRYSANRERKILTPWQQTLLWHKLCAHDNNTTFPQGWQRHIKQLQQAWGAPLDASLAAEIDTTIYRNTFAAYQQFCDQYSYTDAVLLLESSQKWLQLEQYQLVLHGFFKLSPLLEHFLSLFTASQLCYIGTATSPVMRAYRHNHTKDEYHSAIDIASQHHADPVHIMIAPSTTISQRLYHDLQRSCNPKKYAAMLPLGQSQPTPDLTLSEHRMALHLSSTLAEHYLCQQLDAILEFYSEPTAGNLVKLMLADSWQQQTIATSIWQRCAQVECVSNQCHTSVRRQLSMLEKNHAEIAPCLEYIDLIIARMPSSGAKNWPDWLQWWINTIATLGWPHGNFQPTEQQVLTRIFDCFHRFDPSAIGYTSPVTFESWLECLRAALQQPYLLRLADDHQLIVTGWQTAFAQPCTTMSVLGIHSETWPPPQLPAEDLDLTWQNLCADASACYLHSSIQNEQEQMLVPSVVVADDQWTSYPKIASIPFVHTQYDCRQRPIESIITDVGIAKTLSVSALTAYSHCPCKGSLRQHFHTHSGQTTAHGFSAAELGTIVHHCLQHWHSRPLSDLDQFELWLKPYLLRFGFKHAVSEFTLQILISHLGQLIPKWLQHSAKLHQDDITTHSKYEVAFTRYLGGIQFNLRADRVDYLSDGGIRIVDYKTGHVARRNWAGDRLRDPQLPLYAVTLPNVNAISYASLHPDQWGYLGISATKSTLAGVMALEAFAAKADSIADWQDLLKQWHAQMLELIALYKRADMRLNPIDAQACQQCGLQSVCRVYEQNNLSEQTL